MGRNDGLVGSKKKKKGSSERGKRGRRQLWLSIGAGNQIGVVLGEEKGYLSFAKRKKGYFWVTETNLGTRSSGSRGGGRKMTGN